MCTQFLVDLVHHPSGYSALNQPETSRTCFIYYKFIIVIFIARVRFWRHNESFQLWKYPALCYMLLYHTCVHVGCILLFSEEMRRWFLNQETELLKCRFMRISAQEREDFFLQHKDEYCFDTVPISFQDHVYKASMDMLWGENLHAYKRSLPIISLISLKKAWCTGSSEHRVCEFTWTLLLERGLWFRSPCCSTLMCT